MPYSRLLAVSCQVRVIQADRLIQLEWSGSLVQRVPSQAWTFGDVVEPAVSMSVPVLPMN